MIGAAGQLLLVLLALAVVIAMILGAAWLARRYGGASMLGGSTRMRTLAMLHVGQRERVVLLEVQGVQLLLGVAAGSVRRLHSFPTATLPDGAAPGAEHDAASAGEQDLPAQPLDLKSAFALVLKRALGRQAP